LTSIKNSRYSENAKAKKQKVVDEASTPKKKLIENQVERNNEEELNYLQYKQKDIIIFLVNRLLKIANEEDSNLSSGE
jgi:hypothetical protein